MWFNLKIIHHKGKLEFKKNEGSQASLVFGICFICTKSVKAAEIVFLFKQLTKFENSE